MPFSTQRLAATRRHALGLALLSLAGLPLALPPEAEGKRNRNKRKGNDRCGRKVKRAVAETCGRQFDPCMTSAADLCSRAVNPAVCQVQLGECCGFMGRGEPEPYLACITALVSTLPTP